MDCDKTLLLQHSILGMREYVVARLYDQVVGVYRETRQKSFYIPITAKYIEHLYAVTVSTQVKSGR